MLGMGALVHGATMLATVPDRHQAAARAWLTG